MAKKKPVKVLSVRLTDGKASIEPDMLHEWAVLNNKVITWLKENTHIKISHICDEAQINQGNLSVAIGKGQISQENLEKIIEVIKKFGYK